MTLAGYLVRGIFLFTSLALFMVCVGAKASAGLPLILRTQLKRATIGEEVCHGNTAEEIFQRI